MTLDEIIIFRTIKGLGKGSLLSEFNSTINKTGVQYLDDYYSGSRKKQPLRRDYGAFEVYFENKVPDPRCHHISLHLYRFPNEDREICQIIDPNIYFSWHEINKKLKTANIDFETQEATDFKNIHLSNGANIILENDRNAIRTSNSIGFGDIWKVII